MLYPADWSGRLLDDLSASLIIYRKFWADLLLRLIVAGAFAARCRRAAK
jgi:hypothetical protein